MKVLPSSSFDSAGAIAPQSVAFVNKLYASVNDDDVKREWNSESERLRLKKFFIDSLSMTYNIISQNGECGIYVLCAMFLARNLALYILKTIHKCLMKTHTMCLMKEEQFYVMERLVFDRLIFPGSCS